MSKIQTIIDNNNVTEEELEKQIKETKTRLKGLISDEGALEIIIKKNGYKKKEEKNKMSLEGFFDDLNLEDESYPDFLKIENNVVYTLKLADKNKPRTYKDKWKNKNYAFNVILLDIEPEEAKKDYILNKEYTFSMRIRCLRRMRAFFIATGKKYDATFTFERVGERFDTDYIFKIKE